MYAFIWYNLNAIFVMGKWQRLQEIQKEGREIDKSRRENLAKFFFDLAKLPFAGLVIGGVISLYSDWEKTEYWYVIATGIIFTSFLAYIGNELLKNR